MKALHQYDCLRANKATSAWGLEVRVPFLDKEFINVAMGMDPEWKMVLKCLFRPCRRHDLGFSGEEKVTVPSALEVGLRGEAWRRARRRLPASLNPAVAAQIWPGTPRGRKTAAHEEDAPRTRGRGEAAKGKRELRACDYASTR